MEPVDGLAFIGHNPLDADNVYIVTGDSGMGMTHGTIAGILLTDLIQGRQNPGQLYDPSASRCARRRICEGEPQRRRPVHGLGHEGRCSVGRRHPEDSGAVVRRGPKVAVYRDATGVARAFGGLPASRLHRGVEPGRENLGLPVPRIAVRRVWPSHERSGEQRSRSHLT